MSKKMWKVLCPIAGKDGTTAYWARLGNAHTNRDESINVYLDTLPTNGKIQLREWTEQELRERSEKRGSYQSRGTLGGDSMTSMASLPSSAQEPIPF
jgi:hypothetical protein